MSLFIKVQKYFFMKKRYCGIIVWLLLCCSETTVLGAACSACMYPHLSTEKLCSLNQTQTNMNCSVSIVDRCTIDFFQSNAMFNHSGRARNNRTPFLSGETGRERARYSSIFLAFCLSFHGFTSA